MEEQRVEKKSKKWMFAIPVAVILTIAMVYATSLYFHQVNVDITVSEARSSGDTPFSLTCMSGETVTHDVLIHNSANVALNAVVSWTEVDNANGVTYSTNLPQTVTINALSDLTVTASVTCNPTTEAGIVHGTVNFEKA